MDFSNIDLFDPGAFASDGSLPTDPSIDLGYTDPSNLADVGNLPSLENIAPNPVISIPDAVAPAAGGTYYGGISPISPSVPTVPSTSLGLLPTTSNLSMDFSDLASVFSPLLSTGLTALDGLVLAPAITAQQQTAAQNAAQNQLQNSIAAQSASASISTSQILTLAMYGVIIYVIVKLIGDL